jgi:hypothetical protein
MFFRTAIRGAVAAAAILFLTSVASMAQDFRGTIIGTVSDRTGGVLSGVTVTITNTETQVVQTVVTDAQGLYQVRYLNPGPYAVTAELQGFKKFSRIDNDVRVGDVLRVDVPARSSTWRSRAARMRCTALPAISIVTTAARRRRG